MVAVHTLHPACCLSCGALTTIPSFILPQSDHTAVLFTLGYFRILCSFHTMVWYYHTIPYRTYSASFSSRDDAQSKGVLLHGGSHGGSTVAPRWLHGGSTVAPRCTRRVNRVDGASARNIVTIHHTPRSTGSFPPSYRREFFYSVVWMFHCFIRYTARLSHLPRRARRRARKKVVI